MIKTWNKDIKNTYFYMDTKIAFSNQLHYVTGLRDRNETGM